MLPIKTKALWARKGGDAPPMARPLTIRAAPTEAEWSEDPSSEEAPLHARVTVARRGTLASRAPFGQTSPVNPPRASVAPSGVLKRTSLPSGGAAPKRARVAAREGTDSPDVQIVAPPEPIVRSPPMEVSSSPREDQGMSSRRSDKGMWFLLSCPFFFTYYSLW